MQNLNLILDITSDMRSQKIKYTKRNCSIDSIVIKELIELFYLPKKVFDISFENVYFEDIIVIQCFELLIYQLLKNGGKIDLSIKLTLEKEKNLNNHFYITSYINSIHKQYNTVLPFNRRITSKRVNKKLYLEFFKKNQNLVSSYRMFLTSDEISSRDIMTKKNKDLLEGMKKISKTSELSKDYILDMREMILELVANVKNHTEKSDVLLQVNVLDVIKSDTNKEHKFFAISFVSISEHLLYEETKKFYTMFERENAMITEDRKERYTEFMSIYKNHVKQFCEEYTKDHFFMLQSFQDGLTTRENTFGSSSGSGLANAINVISNEIDDNVGYSYVYSGDKVCYFRSKALNFNNGICSFNEAANYNLVPDTNICYFSNVFFPGTAYQLIFPIKKEQAYENL